MSAEPLLRVTEYGLYCPAGDFYIDPWTPVTRAVVTHAHSDHLVASCKAYLVAQPGEAVFRIRLDPQARLQPVPYGEKIKINDVTVSLHPAGHILGSAQVRVEWRGEVWVVSGDYKTEPDATCTPFELVPCNTFITESTFGLPIFRWENQAEVFAAINAWWRQNQEAGRASVLLAYALGKAQRILAGVDTSIGPIYTHGSVEYLCQAYRQAGIVLPVTERAAQVERPQWSRALILAPPSAQGTPWIRRFGSQSSGFASGWMRVRGMRRRKTVDRGFVLSDHVDWPSMMQVIQDTGAQHIWVTHGYIPEVVRWLREQGLDAAGLSTRFSDQADETLEEGGEA